MVRLNKKIESWIFDLDNTLYPADSGIFQQVHVLMGKFISKHLNIDIKKAKEIQRKYYKQHGTTLRGLMDNHEVDPDTFLKEVHELDYSIVHLNYELKKSLKNLNGKKFVFTNANKKHANIILGKLQIADLFEGVFDIKMANYIPKPEIEPYKKLIETYNINPQKSVMFDDIAKNLVPASKVGFTTVWINVGHENFSDDIASSKKYLDHQTTSLSNWLNSININAYE
jgi:putative hydrolase of the HAD superfamily